MEKRLSQYQAVVCVLLLFFGLALLVASFIEPPTGVIDPSVLTAFGEILTFAGAIIGIDAKYRHSSRRGNRSENNNNNESCECRNNTLRVTQTCCKGNNKGQQRGQ